MPNVQNQCYISSCIDTGSYTELPYALCGNTYTALSNDFIAHSLQNMWQRKQSPSTSCLTQPDNIMWFLYITMNMSCCTPVTVAEAESLHSYPYASVFTYLLKWSYTRWNYMYAVNHWTAFVVEVMYQLQRSCLRWLTSGSKPLMHKDQ